MALRYCAHARSEASAAMSRPEVLGRADAAGRVAWLDARLAPSRGLHRRAQACTVLAGSGVAPGGHAVLVYVTCPSTTHLFTPSNPAT